MDDARRTGGWTGLGAAVFVGVVVAVLAGQDRLLLGMVGAGTVVLALLAAWAGRWVGPLIAVRSWPLAALLGMLTGLGLLLALALLASLVGLCWGIYDGVRGPDWAYSYLGKPLLAVLVYGSGLASLVGLCAGLCLRALTRTRTVGS